jgi:hypothetical protein
VALQHRGATEFSSPPAPRDMAFAPSVADSEHAQLVRDVLSRKEGSTMRFADDLYPVFVPKEDRQGSLT